MLPLINLKLLYMALKRKVPQGIIHPLSMVCANPHFLLILYWRGVLCPAHRGSPTASPSRFYLTSSNRNGSAPKKRVINHFKRTVIYHHRNDSHSTCSKIVRYLLRLPAACHSLKRMTTCREPKVCLAGATCSRKVNHTLSKRQS